MGLEFRGEVWAREIMSYTINAWLILQAMTLDEICLAERGENVLAQHRVGAVKQRKGEKEEPGTQMRNCASERTQRSKGTTETPGTDPSTWRNSRYSKGSISNQWGKGIIQ